MIRGHLIHPQIVAGLAKAGHGSQVLISDGHYPHSSGSSMHAEIVYLNLRPGLVNVTEVLNAVSSTVAIEAATVMQPDDGTTPGIYAEFEQLLPDVQLERVDRTAFYEQARGNNVVLTIATGELQTWANILITIGVVESALHP